MIDVKTGDILKSRCHALVNTVNCVGIMGKGIALAFKRRYPTMFEDYVARCERGEVRLGKPYVYDPGDGHLIVNFPTKNHWRAVSRLDDIVEGLRYLIEHYEEWGVRSLAVPPLGCGNGQLEWSVVGPTLHRELARLPIPVEIYAPMGTPQKEMQLDFFNEPDEMLAPQAAGKVFIEPGWLALAEVVARIGRRHHGWPVGRTRFQKIAYFLEALGMPLQLEHHRDSFGPYSPHVKSIISKLVNNGLLVERKRGQMLELQVGPTHEDARDVYADELARWENEITRVTDLFVRMRSDQTEVVASVHFVASEITSRLGRRPSEIEVRDEVLRWKERRRPPLAPEAVESAIASMAMLGWIDVDVSPELHPDDEDLLVS